MDYSKCQVVAKVLIGRTTYRYFQEDYKKLRCPKCGTLTVRKLNPKFRIRQKKSPIYSTFDGYYIVHEQFKLFCEANNYEGLEFIQLPAAHKFYWFRPTKVYKIDWGRGLTHRTPKCDMCGYSVFYVPLPTFKMPGFDMGSDDFICRTDEEFGSFRDPMIIIGLETEKKLREAGFKGLHFEPVYF